MKIDVQSVAGEVLLIKINTKVEELSGLLRKYVVYKLFSAEDYVTCGELATETNDIYTLLTALTEYSEKEKMKQDLFKMLHEEAAKFRENDNENKID